MANPMMPRPAATDLDLPVIDGVVAVAAVGQEDRWTLRGSDEALTQFCSVLNLARPERLRATVNGQRAALWLGPDEILAFTEAGAVPLLNYGQGVDGAVVAVGDKFAGLRLDGPKVEAVLAAHCPQDVSLASFPVGKVSRTLYAKAEIVLWRTAASSFRVEVVRSFLPYVVAVMSMAAQDIAALDRR